MFLRCDKGMCFDIKMQEQKGIIFNKGIIHSYFVAGSFKTTS